jgi:hypothetical protein
MRKKGLPKKELETKKEAFILLNEPLRLLNKQKEFKSVIKLKGKRGDKNFMTSYVTNECEVNDDKVMKKYFEKNRSALDLLFWESLNIYHMSFMDYESHKTKVGTVTSTNPIDGLLDMMKKDKVFTSIVKSDLAKKSILNWQLMECLQILKDNIDFKLTIEGLKESSKEILKVSRKQKFEISQLRFMSVNISSFTKDLFGKPAFALAARIINYWMPELKTTELEKAVTRFYKESQKVMKAK